MGWKFGWIIGCFVLLGQSTEAWNNPSLIPPLGNSLMIKAKTANGRLIFTCNTKHWMLIGTAADLVLADNQSVKIGVHNSNIVNMQQPKSVETWILDNPVGDAAESGSYSSSVSGKQIFSVPSEGVISEALIQATAHQAQGRASLVSYIQRLFPKGGQLPAPPQQETSCDQDSAQVEVPYEAEYWIWQQDLLPPSLPSSLAISTSERVVQGLYGEGVVYYRFSNAQWEQIQAEAKIYNVPGGVPTGEYSMRVQHSSSDTSATTGGEVYSWKFYNPSGFRIIGKAKVHPVSVVKNCLPWSLVAITHHLGNVSALGEYTHVQTLSTRGGLPSTHYSTLTAVSGTLWKAPFSAVFWFYTNS